MTLNSFLYDYYTLLIRFGLDSQFHLANVAAFVYSTFFQQIGSKRKYKKCKKNLSTAMIIIMSIRYMYLSGTYSHCDYCF